MEVISATDKQRALAETQKDAIIASANTLIEGIAPLREQAVAEFESEKPNAKVLHANLDRASVLITAFAHDASSALCPAATRIRVQEAGCGGGGRI